MRRVIVAPDKFKGSLGALAVARHLAAGILAVRPDAEVTCVPVADGGEGTLEAAIAAGYERHPVTVHGPTGEPLRSQIAVRGRTALVELALASGLAQLPGGVAQPLRASSHGTGELVVAALDLGCTQIVLGLGGSACSDGGAGMLVALGARVLDDDGGDIPPGGAGLARVCRVDLSGLDRRLLDVRIVLASDVDNPLTGPLGAATVYAPQKGADPGQVTALEAALQRWSQVLDPPMAQVPGAGAAGGVGYAALAALGARRRSGIEVVLDLTGLRDLLPGADLVVTGEGALDAQTLRGKAPAGVAAAARAAGVRVVAACGRRNLGAAALAAAGFSAAYPLTDVEPDVERCLAEPGPLLEELGRRIASAWLALP